MGSAFVVCKKCGKLVRLGEQRLATNKKHYCKDCYKLVEESAADRLIKITESLPSTKELRGGKDTDDSIPVKSPKKNRKKPPESGEGEEEV
jgi:hypothetical protein